MVGVFTYGFLDHSLFITAIAHGFIGWGQRGEGLLLLLFTVATIATVAIPLCASCLFSYY